jgi:hypothetical protein
MLSLVGSEMCIRDRYCIGARESFINERKHPTFLETPNSKNG